MAEFNAVIIETTGLADPAPVAQTFCVEDEVKSFYKLDGIITVVDAKHWLQHVREEKPEGVENEASEQVAFADRVLLNKIDLVDETQLTEVEAAIKEINCNVQIIRSQQSKVDPMKLLNIDAFSLKRVLEMDPEFLNVDGEHQHDSSVSSCSFRVEGDVNVNRMEALIQAMLQTKATDLFRYKGVMAVKGWKSKYVFQGVHMLFEGTFAKGYEWKPDEKRESVLVFIGRNLDKQALESMFKACVAEELRFKVGDEVEAWANDDDGYVQGKVSKVWNAEGEPYELTLTSGTTMTVPDDTEYLVRAVKKARTS